jgi:hypothetical protein
MYILLTFVIIFIDEKNIRLQKYLSLILFVNGSTRKEYYKQNGKEIE